MSLKDFLTRWNVEYDRYDKKALERTVAAAPPAAMEMRLAPAQVSSEPSVDGGWHVSTDEGGVHVEGGVLHGAILSFGSSWTADRESPAAHAAPSLPSTNGQAVELGMHDRQMEEGLLPLSEGMPPRNKANGPAGFKGESLNAQGSADLVTQEGSGDDGVECGRGSR